MPLLDSFRVNHKLMTAPAVRLAKTMNTKEGSTITVFDLRFCKPNENIMSEKGIHTLEHLYAGFMREALNNDEVEIIDCSPMGCRTGFYMSVIGNPSAEKVVRAWKSSMYAVLEVRSENEIPELNEYQCGTFTMHSLEEAKSISRQVIDAGIDVMDNNKLHLSDSRMLELGI